ncbi:phage tail tube protein [Paraburkholderia silviterrae]|uniref:Phage tail protein n=1 Tax=Paraburkholderia silviterrae TaxID=2528715 RepID=A0A4V6PJ62_9BURK|nr:phage tail tube protein [Paraburkholderia silviterrae]TDG25361.1 phage tail protein [Paraburkholderia silviterrae]
MTSSAISAQGSTLQVSGGSGAAKNITAIALGFPTILTSVAHGFANGDIETLAGLTGADAALLNGQAVVVHHVTANTFAVNVDTTGKTITAGGTATPVAWTLINNLKSFKGFDGQANEIDKTNLSSTAKEYMLGLQDFGHFTFDVDKDFNDPGQVACSAAKRAGSLKNFKLTLPNGKTATWAAYVKNDPLDGGVDQLLTTTGVSLRISGDVTYA